MDSFLMESRISYCEGQRYLVNEFMYFENMITDGKTTVGFPDWTFAGIGSASALTATK